MVETGLRLQIRITEQLGRRKGKRGTSRAPVSRWAKPMQLGHSSPASGAVLAPLAARESRNASRLLKPPSPYRQRTAWACLLALAGTNPMSAWFGLFIMS